jgi:acetyl CoA:N6-hydroxylysine acetyl transferase
MTSSIKGQMVESRSGGALCFAGGTSAGDALRAICEAFELHRSQRILAIELDGESELVDRLARLGVVGDAKTSEGGRALLDCTRSTLFQRSEPWLLAPASAGYPLRYTMSQGKRHPARPPIPAGVVYRRRVPEVDGVVTLRTVSIADDLDTIHRWMNDPRVAAFWELAGSRESHETYLATVLADRHVHPLIGCFDGNPFGYFEAYWAKEDRIAPFYDAGDYDRGIHMLVGERDYRGPHRVAAWLPSLVHYLFLDDPRTQYVVAEPRSDNARMIDYLARAGFCKTKEFDFPHKRAALMMVSREVFFDERCP